MKKGKIKGEPKLKVKKDRLTMAIKFKRFLLMFTSIGIILLSSGLFLLYGPWNYVRETLITTAMTTMTHQYLAKWFYSDKTINGILSGNEVIEGNDITDPGHITIKPEDKNPVYANEYEKQILEKDKDNDLYKIIPVSGKGYKGYLVAVYDPSKVHIATTKYLGKRGQSTKVMAIDNNAVIAINASGFYDPDWNSNGSTPHGTVIKDGKVVWDYEDARVGGGFMGFTKENKFVLGRMSKNQALQMGMRDAIEFGPFLVVNGKPSFIKGNGGWGIAPRSAIGQRKDGIVLMLIIDGRRADSIGADMGDLADIMVKYGAYNAGNLDGGSSTSLIVNKNVYNHPVAGGSEGLRNLPTAWIVTE
ncbi:MAG: phosphodiester glycosidase family protein [Bacilli bacterium]